MRKRMGKKGVSPIIAVVLLIAIVVGLGAVLMTISRNFMSESEENIEEKTEVMKCNTDVQINFVETAGGFKVVETPDGTYTVTVEAGPYMDIDTLVLTAIGATTGEDETTTGALGKGKIDTFIFTPTPAVIDPTKIKVVPTFKGEAGNTIICPQSGIEAVGADLSLVPTP
ncbi:MAG: archaellin/type IV pilin N-terminal domain-containing protein [Candidatus Woesearchaeota archaeon]